MPENNFISSYTSFLTLSPTKENIEAIEDVELLVINRENLEKLSKEVLRLKFGDELLLKIYLFYWKDAFQCCNPKRRKNVMKI
jgi:hypothetical protein